MEIIYAAVFDGLRLFDFLSHSLHCGLQICASASPTQRRSGDVPEFELRGEDGRAIDTQQIFSGGGTDYTPLFRALIVQRHKRALSDDEFLQLLKAHVDHGFQLIKNDTAGFKSEDDYVNYLVELTRAGLEQRTQEAAPQIEATPAYGRFD